MIPWKNWTVTDPMLISKTIWVVLKKTKSAGIEKISVLSEHTEYLEALGQLTGRRKKRIAGETYKLMPRQQNETIDLNCIAVSANFR